MKKMRKKKKVQKKSKNEKCSKKKKKTEGNPSLLSAIAGQRQRDILRLDGPFRMSLVDSEFASFRLGVSGLGVLSTGLSKKGLLEGRKKTPDTPFSQKYQGNSRVVQHPNLYQMGQAGSAVEGGNV